MGSNVQRSQYRIFVRCSKFNKDFNVFYKVRNKIYPLFSFKEKIINRVFKRIISIVRIVSVRINW